MQTIVGVLRGGPSREHEISLKSGAAILKHLPRDRFDARDIYIDKGGQWHDRGRPTAPDRVLRQLDVVLNGLHGEYGGDGEVQKLLERFGVPYAGADPLSSYLATHKVLAKARAVEAGLLTPAYRHAERASDSEAIAKEVIRSFMQPVVVKPIGWGSSVGVSIVGGYAEVLKAIKSLFDSGAASVLVEERIKGREATVGVIEGFRGESLYALPTTEIILPAGGFFSYDSKNSGAVREVTPGTFSRVVTEELRRAAKVIHRALGLRHYSRSDFIVTPKGIYYLETNTLPSLTDTSLMPRSMAAVGIHFPAFLTHLVDLALTR